MGVLDELLAEEQIQTRKTKEQIAEEIVREAGLTEGAISRLSSSLLKSDLQKLAERLKGNAHR